MKRVGVAQKVLVGAALAWAGAAVLLAQSKTVSTSNRLVP